MNEETILISEENKNNKDNNQKIEDVYTFVKDDRKKFDFQKLQNQTIQSLDSVSSPAYYARLRPQTIQRLQEVLTPEEFQGFCRGNIIKYCERMRHKDNPVNESAKVVRYAKWLNQSLKGEKVSV